MEPFPLPYASLSSMIKMLINVLTGFCLFLCVSCSVLLSPSSLNIEPNNDNIAEMWQKSGDIIEPFIWPHRRPLIDVLEKVVNEADSRLSEGCNRSLALTLEGLLNRDTWAYKMMDASSKFSPGFLNTQYTDFGDFDQCLGIDVNKQSIRFSGKYCLYRIHFPLPEYDKHSPANMSLFGNKIEGKWLQIVAQNYKAFYYETINNAVCVPSTCSSKDMQWMLQKYIFQNPLKVTFWPECDTKETVSIPFINQPLYTKLSGTILIAWASFVMLSTALTHFVPDSCPAWMSFLSIVSNSNATFREPSHVNPMESVVVPTKLNFMALGYYLHVYYVNLFHFNPPSAMNQVGWFGSKFGTLSHTFLSNIDMYNSGMFTLSGMMTYYVWHDIMSKTKGKLGFGPFVIPRLLRCYPLVIIPSLATMAFPLVPGMGPVFRHFYKDMAAKSYRYLIYDLTFTTNLPFLDFPQFTHLITWAIAADVQLYVTSFYAIYLLFNRPKKGLILSFGLLLTSMVAQGIVMYSMDATVFTDSVAVDMKKFADDVAHVYLSTLSNAPAYYIGIIFGYSLANGMTISKTSRRIGWLGFCLCFLFYGNYFVRYSRAKETRSLHWFIIMGILRKMMACLLLCWLGYGFFYKEKAFAWLSSLNPPIYVSRMFGSINMVHYHVLSYMLVSTRKPFENNSQDVLQRLITLVALSLLIGFIVHVLLEAPLNNLTTKLLLKENQSKSVKEDKIK